MSKIQERLDSLQPHIVGIRYIQGTQIVDAVFKDGWSVPDSDVIKKELVEKSSNYYMFFTEKEGVTIDDLLDYVEEIININIEREKKYELLREKVEELKVLFKEKSLQELQELKFTFNKPGVMPSLSDMDDISIDDELIEETTNKKGESIPPPADKEEVEKTNSKVNGEINIKNVKGQNIELPPKNGKIELEEYSEPEIVCKCGPDDVCPVCEEEKIGSY
jgi:hypothetical protein